MRPLTVKTAKTLADERRDHLHQNEPPLLLVSGSRSTLPWFGRPGYRPQFLP
jgi:hypothetical protein